MKLSTFTVMIPDLSPEDAVQELKDAGYDGVEWRVTKVPEDRKDEEPSFWGNNLCTLAPTEAQAHRARALAESAGLAISNIGAYVSIDDREAVENVVQFARIAGSPHVRVSPGGLEGQPYTERFQEVKDTLHELEPLAIAEGVKLLIEIHHGTVCPSASSAYRLVRDLSPEAFGVIYDPGNMVQEGFEDYRIGVDLLGPYLAYVHVKNCGYRHPEKGTWEGYWAPLDDGIVDFVELLRVLKRAGYDGWLSMEDFSQSRSSTEALRFNIDYLKDVLKKASD